MNDYFTFRIETDLRSREEEQLRRWEAMDLYQTLLEDLRAALPASFRMEVGPAPSAASLLAQDARVRYLAASERCVRALYALHADAPATRLRQFGLLGETVSLDGSAEATAEPAAGLDLDGALHIAPADAVRLATAALTDSAQPLTPQLLRAAETRVRSFRRSFAGLLLALEGHSPRKDTVRLDRLAAVDLFMLGRFHKLVADTSEHYAAGRLGRALERLELYCREDLEEIYLPFAERGHRSTRTALHSILFGLVKLIAPILPFTADEVWPLVPGIGGCASVHLGRWPRCDDEILYSRRAQEVQRALARWLVMRREVDGLAPKAARRDSRLRLALPEGFLGTATIRELAEFLGVAEVMDDQAAGSRIAFEPSRLPVCRGCGHRAESDPCHACIGDDVKVAIVSGPEALHPGIAPAEVAVFLKQRSLDKVAILNEGGECRAWALDPETRQVTRAASCEPLADYINRSPDFRRHAAVLLAAGPHTGVLFGVGIHHLKYGTPLGGTREMSYPAIGNLIDDLLRLSWGMSVKNAVAGLPQGGGKSIIDPCGLDLKIHRELRRSIYRDYGHFNATLFGRYICAGDVGNTTADTREMLSSCRHVMNLPRAVGGTGNPSRFAALVGWASAKAGWKFLTGTSSFAGLTVAIQGMGNVGLNLVRLLVEGDPALGRILIADKDPERLRQARGLLAGYGREELMQVASSVDPEGNASSLERDDEAGKEYILYAQSDILVPVAVGKMIHPGNVARLGCKLILPIANNVYTDNDAVAAAMHERGIVDVVENNANWGGAIAAASELFGYDEEHVTEASLEAYPMTLALLEEARKRNCPPWKVVQEMAARRVFEEQHPVVSAARKVKFIGDIEDGFARWMKERWLTGQVDVPADRFAGYAVELARRLWS